MKKLLYILLLLTPFLSNATTYYVSNSGSDGNNGTSTGTPWQTVTKVNGSTFVAGDIIQFNGGQTFTGTLTVPNSGASGNPITFQSYGTGNATISVAGVDGVDVFNQSWVTVQNLNIIGDATANGVGVYASASTNGNTKFTGLIFNNLSISSIGGGVLMGGDPTDGSGSGFTNSSITNCTIHDCVSFGIQSYGAPYGTGVMAHSGLTISGDLIYNIVGSGTSGSGILLAETTASTIQNNTVHDCSATGGGSFAVWAYDCTNLTIQFNEAYKHKTNNGSDGGGFDLDGGVSGSVMQYNYAHDNDGPGFMIYSYNDGGVTTNTNNTCRYNISYNDGKNNSSNIGSLVIGASTSGVLTNFAMYNNSAYQGLATSSVAGFFGANVGAITGIFSNNILEAIGGAKLINTIGSNPSSLTVTGNDYYNTGTFSLEWNGTTYTTFAAWQTATGQEKIAGVDVHKAVDPVFMSPNGGAIGYKLAPTSGVIGQGLNLNTIYGITIGTQDYFGYPLASPYSIGANQYTILKVLGRIVLH